MRVVSSTGNNQDSERRASRSVRVRLFSTAKYLSRPLLAALLVASIDSLGLFLLQGSIVQSTLVLLLFLEAGVGLIAGVGIALSSTPSVSRMGQTLLGADPWSREAERHAERVGSKWLIASVFLVSIGFVLSVA